MGIVYFPQFDQVLGVRESDGALILAGGVAITPAEIGLVDGITAGTVTASKALVVDASKDLATLRHLTTSGNLLTSGSVGTVTTAATTVAEEHGDGVQHFTKLTLTNFAVGTSGDAAALGIGAKLYTFPAGTIAVESTSMVGGVTAAISVTTDTPEVGLGTVIASGVVSVLSGTATFEDLMDGNASGVGGDTVAPDVAGGTLYKTSNFTAPVCIKTTGGKSHDVFLNAAVTWADVAAVGAVTFTGVITIKWRIVS